MWLGIACLVVATGTAGGAYLYFHESVAAVAAKTPEVRRAAQQLDVALPGQPAVALVIGYDHRKEDGRNASGRSDTLMLVRADPATDSISLLSFPRDMRVEIRCPRADAVLRQDQRRLRQLRPAGLAPDGQGAHRRPDQLPHHGQLPRLPSDRGSPRWRVDRRRPALLQRSRRPWRLRDDQPAARLPAARRDARRSTTSAIDIRTPTSTALPGSSSS